MDFLFGLSVGMHLGKVIADCLEKVFLSCGLLSPETVKELDEVQVIEEEIRSVVERVVD